MGFECSLKLCLALFTINAILYLTLVIVFASLVAAYYNEGDPCYAPDPTYYGYYAPHPVYCYRFLQCTHGIFIGRNCAPGLHWNPAEGACDWPSEANCDGLTTQRTTTTTTQATTTTTEGYPPTDTTYYTDSTYYTTDSTYYTTDSTYSPGVSEE